MAKLRVRFTFTPELIQEPVIWQLGQKFPIVTNIRRADVREAFGWALLELEGDADQINQGIEWVRSTGIEVQLITGDVIE
jgi:ABC-type methionine transport system ATPase subunit